MSKHVYFVVERDDLSTFGYSGGMTKAEAEESLRLDPEANLVVIYGEIVTPQIQISLPNPDEED